MARLSRNASKHLLAAFALASSFAASPAAARQLAAPAASPTEIRPLLLGAEAPAVGVLGLDGEPTDLRSVLGGKPTLLVFYRGGW